MFVEKRKWIKEDEYAQLIALSQFLPGPGSSQVGFAIGMKKMGVLGGITAFIGFTLPSFALMAALAAGYVHLQEASWLDTIIHSLKLLAVIVVLDATLSMSKSFCKEKYTQIIALLTCAVLIISPIPFSQIYCLIAAAAIGSWLLKNDLSSESTTPPQKISIHNLTLLFGFVILFTLCLFQYTPFNEVFEETFVAGSLVFGGGHVVLPLLSDFFNPLIGEQSFITGYAAAQAIPGPMFTFATYLGALSHENPLIGASLATLGIFLPGFILLIIFEKHWQQLAQRPKVSGMVKGVNAAVVGLLAATLYNPIFSSSVISSVDMACVVIGILLLRVLNWSIFRLISLALVLSLLQIVIMPR
ncbi:chromate efflux transporter [Oceaniserpentilla sp. 4NH20-0058]